MTTNLPTLMNTNSNDEVYEYVNSEGEIVGYDLKRLVLCDTVAEKIPSLPGSNAPPMINYRINIRDRRADGVLQDFLIRTEELFTFGVQESKDQKSGELNGYSLPLPLWNKEGPTPSQLYFTDLLENKILDVIRNHLFENRKTFRQASLEKSDLRKMKVFFRKKDEEGVINPADPPTWYPKLIVSKKKNFKIVTRFYRMGDNGNVCIDEKGNPVEFDAQALIGKWGKARAVIKLDSIYVRSEGFSVQCKIWEADFRPTEASLARKAKINRSSATVITTSDSNPMSALMGGDDSFDAGGDISVTDNPPVVHNLTAVRRT